jgi:hypothetical protein
MKNKMDNTKKLDVQASYEYAAVISLACYIAMALAVISFLQDFRLETDGGIWRFGKGWIHKIPEWLVLLLDCGCWCALFLGIGNYCQKNFSFKSSLFPVLAGLEVAIFLLSMFLEETDSFAIIGLYFLVAIAYCVIMLITGIHMNKTGINRYIPAAFIIYSVAYLVVTLLLPAIIIDAAIDGSEESPIWLTTGSLIMDLVSLYLITKVFVKMADKKDLEDARKEIFNNKNSN